MSLSDYSVEAFEELHDLAETWVSEINKCHQTKNKSMSNEELKALIEYLNQVYCAIPRGLPDLRHAISFAILDLLVCVRTGCKNPNFDRALAFGQSIPKVDDMNGDILTAWMLHDREHEKVINGWCQQTTQK